MSIYLELTREFNAGRLRAVITSGQAVVLHRLAVTSKDGDWILREDEEALQHVLGVLAGRAARYRFGAPLDLRWMRGGWSSHFEFRAGLMRIRTDFFTRPPRVTAQQLDRLWSEQEGRDPPFVDLHILAEMKKTDREKDYAVLGEIARLMDDPRDQLLFSRSARDLIELARKHPALVTEIGAARPVLERIAAGREVLETALDAERRALMRVNESRLEGYERAVRDWREAWPRLSGLLEGSTLRAGHRMLVEEAQRLLPAAPAP